MTPRQWQAAVAAVLMAVAVLTQTAVNVRLPLPGASSGLVLAMVLAVGMAGGPTFGLVAGFTAGLAIDVLPPASGIMGATALAFMIAGYVAGRVRDPRGLAPAERGGLIAGLALAAALVIVAFTLALTPAAPAVGALIQQVVTFVLVSGLLGMLLVPAVSSLLRAVGGVRRPRRRRRMVPRPSD